MFSNLRIVGLVARTRLFGIDKHNSSTGYTLGKLHSQFICQKIVMLFSGVVGMKRNLYKLTSLSLAFMYVASFLSL